MRVEVVPHGEPEYLQKQARRCRGAASATLDLQARQTLLKMANEYEQRLEALELEQKRATEMGWGKAHGRIPEPECNGPERTSQAINELSWEELRSRSEQHGIDQARIRILQRAARGLPINVFERKLIAGELPPGL